MRLGPVQLAKRGPSVLWHGVNNTVQIATKPLGFDGASEAERMRWLNGFRRLLDGLEAGWLFRLIPPGLKTRLAWHADPLPVAWVVDYLQRQLTNMRVSRLQELNAGTNDPMLAGALPNTEDLQRRLASSQEKAFHVSVYITLIAATKQALEMGSEQIQSAAHATLCEIQPCTFRMLDGHLATLPSCIDRLARKRVLDTSALVTLFPWFGAEIQQAGGLVVGSSCASGVPVLVDPFEQSR